MGQLLFDSARLQALPGMWQESLFGGSYGARCVVHPDVVRSSAVACVQMRTQLAGCLQQIMHAHVTQ